MSEIQMIAALFFLFVQVILRPCTIEEVPGPAHCGTYRVWENRATRQGRQIDLSIIVLDALRSPRKPDPLFLISGGPGDAPSFNAHFFSHAFATVRQERDLILVDLRGTGKSHPLTCPELGEPDSSGVLDANILGVPALRKCRIRLEQVADLRQYTTEIAVDDLDEVRQALGYHRINLYGTSYGTRVAQVYMRQHPTAIRTVSLKGIVPPSVASPASHARAAENAWQQLVSRCQNDQQCAQSFPSLVADLSTLLKRLETSPIFEVPVKLKISPGLFAESFRTFLYSPEAAARVPKLLRDLVSEKPGLVENSFAGRRMLSGDRLAAGFFLSVSCTEDVPYLPKDTSALVADTFAGDYRLQQQINACEVWPKGQVSSHHRSPTNSAIPTLLLSGEFDPVTPPSGGEEVIRGLTNGLHVVIRNNGHPIGSAEQCIGNMISAFINRGSVDSLDTSCASKVPAVPFAL